MSNASPGIGGSSAKSAMVTGALSDAARQRMLTHRGEPLFLARWDRAVFIHYEAQPESLQQCVPFQLDLRNGRAFVSIVAFTLVRMRPRIGGWVGELLLKPIGTHGFLNIRTYVHHNGESGIYFLGEWLSNRISVFLGPRTFGLPYRFGKINYEHDHEHGRLLASVWAKEGRFRYRATVENNFEICEANSITEFLIERHTAFTQDRYGRRRFFRVWHEPWKQVSINIDVTADELIDSTGDWWQGARCIGADYSPGASVWMGWPHKVD